MKEQVKLTAYGELPNIATPAAMDALCIIAIVIKEEISNNSYGYCSFHQVNLFDLQE